MSPDPKVASRPITPDACWKVLEGAAASDHLKRATRLKEFLYYVGKKSIKEGFSDIHEQEIGQAVFGRKDSYDTSQDNIVRVSATELRRRVDAYFAEEGKGEPLIFEIPRGSYTPIFRWRTEMQLANTGKATRSWRCCRPARVPQAILAHTTAAADCFRSRDRAGGGLRHALARESLVAQDGIHLGRPAGSRCDSGRASSIRSRTRTSFLRTRRLPLSKT